MEKKANEKKKRKDGNTKVAKAVNVFDRFLINFAGFLRGNLVARMLFAGYFILLHIWVFFIISFHTSHLNQEIKQAEALVGKHMTDVEDEILIPGN